MVAVLHNIGASVEGFYDVVFGGTCPFPEFSRRGRDVAKASGTEIGSDGTGARGARPLVAQRAGMDFAKSGGELVVLAEIAVYGRNGDLEP